MADTWNTPELHEALAEMSVANGAQPSAGPPKNEEAIKAARDAGWVQRQAHNYAATAPITVLNGDEDEAEPDAAPAAEGEAGDEDPMTSRHSTTTWSHDAAKYEWKEEYGDVGPRDEKLEKDLFRGEHINRAGNKLTK